MESYIYKKEKNIIFLEVKIPSDQIKKSYIESSKKLSKKINIPGFRKGKAPSFVLEKHIGEKVILDETIDFLISKSYLDIIEKHELDPICNPKINIISIEKNSPLIFNIEVQVVPEGTLKEYKNLNLIKNIKKIEEKDIFFELELLRNKNVILEKVNSKVKNGDIVNIDFEGYVDGNLFEGGSSKNYKLEIGSKTFIPGFEEKLIGTKTLEEKNIQLCFPKDYHVENLRNKKVIFKIKINEIRRKILKLLNDEFAKDVSEFNTLDELKESILKNLNEKNEKNANNLLRNQALDKGIELLEVEIPDSMIKEKTDQFLREIENDMVKYNITLEKYYETSGITEKKIREDYKKNAIKHIKKDILLDNIAKKEKIIISEEEIAKEIEKISKIYNQSKENLELYFKDKNNIKMLKRGLIRERAIDFIIKNAKIKEVFLNEKNNKRS